MEVRSREKKGRERRVGMEMGWSMMDEIADGDSVRRLWAWATLLDVGRFICGLILPGMHGHVRVAHARLGIYAKYIFNRRNSNVRGGRSDSRAAEE